MAWALVVALGGALLTATPAQASTTVLCVGYDSCARAGYQNHGYKAKRFNIFWRMSGDHNCTNYVASILVGKGMPNIRPWAGDGNAYAWGDYTTDYRDSTPVVGAVAWWDANRAPASSTGHVSYVERVISSSQIIVSEDNWKGEFRWKRITKTSGGWPSAFIHFKDSRTPPPPPLAATLTSQSIWTDSSKTTSVVSTALAPGSSAYVELTYRNTGAKTWRGFTLASTDSVVAPNPATAQREDSVTTGKKATFGFTATVPSDKPVGSSWIETFAPRSAAGTVLPSTTMPFGTAAGTNFTLRPRPTIAGVLKQGETLTATTGTWDADAVLSFAWRRNGLIIPNATKQTFVPTATDVGSRLSVSVSATAPGKLLSQQTSTLTGYVSSTTSNTLSRGQSLTSGTQLISRNGLFSITQRSDGNLVIYDRRTNTPIWANAQASAGARVALTKAGSLVTVASSGAHLWVTPTANRGVVSAVIRNDGRFALYSKTGRIVWSSYTSGR